MRKPPTTYWTLAGTRRIHDVSACCQAAKLLSTSKTAGWVDATSSLLCTVRQKSAEKISACSARARMESTATVTAAGAIVDGTTMERAKARRLNVEAHLNAFNAYPLFEALGDAIITGPTGNNLRDLRILLAY